MPVHDIPMLETLLAVGPRAPRLAQKVEFLQGLRAESDAAGGAELDKFILGNLDRANASLKEIQATQNDLRELLSSLTAPPWHLAVFLDVISLPDGPRAAVMYGNSVRVVAAAQGVDLGSLRPGDEIFLAHEQNLILARNPQMSPAHGEIGVFDRLTSNGGLVLRAEDGREVVVRGSGRVDPAALAAGDRVIWDRLLWMAQERVEGGATDKKFLIGEVPDAKPEDVGGQEENLRAILSALTTVLIAPDVAKSYGLGGRTSILMTGPSGVGKTLMAKVAAAEIARLSGKQCRFFVVKPAEWESPWVGVTEQQIRDLFAALREASKDGLAVVFLDEVEACGRTRGNAVGHHSDKALAALLTELDGFVGRQGVAIIAATNRPDLVDPALLERIRDLEISVRRPDMRGAEAIFGIHLPLATLPFHPNGSAAANTRREMIHSAVDYLYSPNSQYRQVARIRLRDGKARTVAAHELISGRTIEQICRSARQAAFLRQVHTGDAGLRLSDMDAAVDQAVRRLASTLTVHSSRNYLSDLPTDNDVVAVESLLRKSPPAHLCMKSPAA